ncbi:MAG: hypothetical protein KC619_07900, partial [Myxococcales bacterium]|nr:hypothetical protein [Myxococcales bacterium]
VRARVVAILIAERLREPELPSVEPEPAVGPAASASASASASVSAPASAPVSASASAPVSASAPASASSLSVSVLDERPAPPRWGAELGTPSLARRAHPGAIHVFHESALAPGRGPQLGVGGDLFVFLDPVTPIAGPTITFGYDALRVEAGWGFGRAADDVLGAVDTHLGHLSAGAALTCVRFTDASLCASAFATLGYARADPRPRGDTVARVAEGVYAGGAVELGAWLATELVAARLGLRGGWGYGLVVGVGETDLAAIGGAWIGASLALTLEPFR